MFKSVLDSVVGRPIESDELWQFLRSLVVLHFDLEHSGSRDTTCSWNRLLDLLRDRDDAVARQFFNSLLAIVASYSKSGDGLTIESLHAELGNDFPLRDRVDCSEDLARLRRHTDFALNEIKTDIGGKLQLPRTELTDHALTKLRESQVLFIIGEPGTGKSALMHTLANRLRQEGEVFATSMARLAGTTLDVFATQLRLKHDFQALLGATSSAPLRCLFVDGLDRAFDSDRRRVLNDIIREIKRFNDEFLSRGGHLERCWRIVATCRREELDNYLPHLELADWIRQNSVRRLDVGVLSDTEIARVVETFPRMAYLTSLEHTQDLLRRPFVLDLLTLPEATLAPEDIPDVLTESWLMEWYWREVVRLAEGWREGKGNSNAREQTLLKVTRAKIQTGHSWLPLDELQAEATQGLVSDRILVLEDARVRFAHDLFEDWAAVRVLAAEKENIGHYLKQCGEPLTLVRPLRLLALRQLEVRHAVDEWLQLLEQVQQKDTLSLRWYQTVLTAPLFSPLLDEMLVTIKPLLFADQGHLLRQFLQATRTICTLPSPVIYQLMEDLPQPELEKYLAYVRIPEVERWLPVLKFVLDHRNELPIACIGEIAELAYRWMQIADVPLRTEVGQFCFDLLKPGLDKKLDDVHYADTERVTIRWPEGSFGEQTTRLLKKAVLWAADVFPKQVEAFVRQALEEDDRDLPDLLLSEEVDWVPLCQCLPALLADAVSQLMCIPMSAADPFGGRSWVCTSRGIRNDHGWRLPPTHLKGPFLGMLQLAPQHGIRLINRITDHATMVWVECEKRERGRTLLPQTLRLSSSEHKIWGDDLVYSWFRYPSVGPHGVTCALMALEYWMTELIKHGADPAKLFEKILSQTSSAAVVGVCVSVALADWRKCAEAAVPILENPAFWHMDRRRAAQESGTAILTLIDMMGGLASEGDRRIAKQIAEAPHRKQMIDMLAQVVLHTGSDNARQRLQDAMKTFPQNPPVFFEEEKSNQDLMAERVEACEFIAARAEPENYEIVAGEEPGTSLIQMTLPDHLETKRQESETHFQAMDSILRLWNWANKSLETGQIDHEFSAQDALTSAQELVMTDEPTQPPTDHEGETRAFAVALAAAALVVCEPNWVIQSGHLAWCREQLLIAATRPQQTQRFDSPVSRFPWDFRRSAARALPLVLKLNPKDRQVRQAVIGLVDDSHYEVRGFLFNALRTVWDVDLKFVWQCISKGVSLSFLTRDNPWIARSRHKPARQTEALAKKWARVARKGAVASFDRVSLREIDYQALACVLYALPLGNDAEPLQLTPQHLVFFDELMSLATRLHVMSQKTYQDRKRDWMQVPPEWSYPFEQLAANWCLYLPFEEANTHILQPILANWEKAYSLIEGFLRALLTSTPPELHPRLVALWRVISERVLSSSTCQNLPHWLERDLKDTLGLLIFYAPIGITWKVDTWEPLVEMTDLVDRWVAAVGHHPRCFPSLIGMLRSIGLPLMSTHGVRWLQSCLESSGDPERLFEKDDDRVSSALANLLHDTWYKHGESLQRDPVVWQQFTAMVDYLALRGEQVAVELQRKIQELSA